MPQYYGQNMNGSALDNYQNQSYSNGMYNTQTQARSYLYGRIVQTGDEIRPNEVLPDGSPTYFPLADRSGIIMREVTRNGTIAETLYSLVDASKQTDPNEAWKAEMTKRIETLEKSVRRNRKRNQQFNKPANNEEGDV